MHRRASYLLAVVALVGCGDDGSTLARDAAQDAPLVDDAAACVIPDAAVATTGPACAANNLPGACIATSECRDSRTPTAGQCAGPSTIQCCTPRFADGITCDPNAQFDPNACLPDEEPGSAGCPAGMVLISTFCIDRFEASIAGHSPYQPPTAPIGLASGLQA